TPEAYRAEFPDREISDEKAERRGKRRRVWALPLRGWALANEGLHSEAEADFIEADLLAERNFIGLTDAGLDSLHGRAALLAGKAQQAVDLLGLPAVMGGDLEALEALTLSLEQVREAPVDIVEWSREIRPKLARNSENFSLSDYSENTLDLSDLAKGKVTLLAFWFPT
ncbi:MAG: hypothetical protein K8R59_01095, partial [Thermoanaerobaculales bacterium]|nr:hypothetical protein [Thermoanaerobaculales bacterium]